MLAELDKPTAAKRLAEALGDRLRAPADVLAQSLEGWDLFDCNGAVVMCRGPEIHVAAPQAMRGQWFTRSDFRRLVGGMLRRFGAVTTAVCADNAPGLRFVKRLGFAETGSSPRGVEFILTGSRYA